MSKKMTKKPEEDDKKEDKTEVEKGRFKYVKSADEEDGLETYRISPRR